MTDRLREVTGTTVRDLSAVFGVAETTVSRWRNPDERKLRPPLGWEAQIATVAREQAPRLHQQSQEALALAAELDPSGSPTP